MWGGGSYTRGGDSATDNTVVGIFLIELLFGNKGIRIEDAQPVKRQAKELC